MDFFIINQSFKKILLYKLHDHSNYNRKKSTSLMKLKYGIEFIRKYFSFFNEDL